MKSAFVLSFLMIAFGSSAQWQAEIMVGMSGYSGDLAESYFAGHTIGPMINSNVKYSAFDDRVVFRAGLAYGQIGAKDEKNEDPSLIARNLNFKSTILEGSLIAEVNLLNPQEYEIYPYVFAGVGAVNFNPYTYDKNNQKTYLHDLGTEGQGLPEYPERKMYSLTQFCIPYGFGVAVRMTPKFDIVYELGARILFTDYLDDVSTTYPDPEILLAARGATAAELSNRYVTQNQSYTGVQRGNPKSNDQYYFMGVKLIVHIGDYNKTYY